MDEKLHRLYAQNRDPVAFLDESYELHEGKTFYILASALVYPDFIPSTRDVLKTFYDGETMHAAPMYRRNEFESLRRAIALVATQNDGMDVVVQAPVEPDDAHGWAARRKCLSFIAPLLHAEEGTTLFVLDSLATPAAEQHDRFTFGDLRKSGQIGRNVAEHHTRPSNEPLLGLPDLIAWSYRQRATRRSREWFEPLTTHTRIHQLK